MTTQTNAKSLTIVSVTGHADYTQGSVYAISRSYRELKDRIPELKCLLISPNKPENLPDYIEHIACAPFSYLEYNIFILFSLGQFIDTEFCLIVQNDGWVLSGKNWRDEFFDYDYIGAPITLLIEPNETRHIAHRYPFWAAHFDNIPENMYEPQNGGFSLRSRRLLNAPRELNIKWGLQAPSFSDRQPFKFTFDDGDHNEDIFLSVGIRKQLEEHGLKFAPSKVAAAFAMENIYVAEKHHIARNEILGVHLTSYFVLTGENEVYMQNDLPAFGKKLADNPIINLLVGHGYEVLVPKKFGYE